MKQFNATEIEDGVFDLNGEGRYTHEEIMKLQKLTPNAYWTLLLLPDSRYTDKDTITFDFGTKPKGEGFYTGG